MRFLLLSMSCLSFLVVVCGPTNVKAMSYKDKIVENERAVSSLTKSITELKDSILKIGRLPVATIVAYWGKVAPEGWLMCDGRKIDEKHFELRKLVGEKTPDLQGYFLRGFDPKGKVDPEGKKRIIGHEQMDQFQTHKHYRYDERGQQKLKVDFSGAKGDAATHTHYPEQNRKLYTGGPYDGNSGRETRPKNIAVNFIPKSCKHL